MNITVKKLAELHKPTHNIRRHSDKQITEYILRILWTTIYNDHNARIKEEQNHGKH